MDFSILLCSAAALTAGAVLGAEARAQTCHGRPGVGQDMPANIGAGVEVFDGGVGYQGQVTVGGGSAFGTGSAGLVTFDNTDLSSKTIGGTLGYRIPASTGAEFCLTMGVGRTFGLEIQGIDISSWSFAPGLSLGLRRDLSETVALVPYGRAALIHARVTGDAGVLGSGTATETYGLLTMGGAMGLERRLYFGPWIAVPVREEDSEASVGLSVSVGVGGG